MKLKLFLIGIITILSCTSCSLLDEAVHTDENGNQYTTTICSHWETISSGRYEETAESCRPKSKLREGTEQFLDTAQKATNLFLQIFPLK